MVIVFGRECKLGWGYNESLDRLVPVEGKPNNIALNIDSEWRYYVYNLSSTNIVFSVSFLLIR